MSQFTPVPPGAAITRWVMAAPETALLPGTARPMPDRVDYRFVNGWFDTGDLPCRQALVAIRQGNDTRPAPCPQADFRSIHLTGDSPDADFSQFCHRPTLIRHLLRCTLSGEGEARFTLSTCGGVRLWLDNRLAAQFQPYTRNRKQTCEITLPLTPDGALLTVELEDLHERDTTCFVSLALIEGANVHTALPGHEHTDLSPILAAMAGLRTDRVFYTSGPVSLTTDALSDEPLSLVVSEIGPFARGGIAGRSGHLAPRTVTLSAQTPNAALFDSATTPQGCIGLSVTAQIATGTLTRHLGTTILTRATSLDQPTLAGRKSAALAAIRTEAAFDPAVALALLANGKPTSHVLAILERSLQTIEQRHDCCDFTLLPLLRIQRDHASLLPKGVADRLRAAILNFRYWLDEPGDDVMWFWSENHVACFHICQLIAGAMFPAQTFPNSGKSGTQHRAEATSRLHRWFDSIEAHGLGEWNSAAYYPIDLLALFTLHDLGGDAALKSRAAALIDTVFIMTGLHTTGGVSAGSQGRAYEKELLAGPATELGTVAAVAFGGGYIASFDRAAALFCLSDYAPPPLASALASPARGETIHARYTQGLDHLGNLTLYKTADVQLSTVTDHKTGQPGHQQHVIDAQCAAHPMARAWINHPGELKEWGERRPSLLAGNGHLPRVAQSGRLAALIYDLPEWAIPFTQLFAPHHAFDTMTRENGWLILASGRARIAVWCSAPLTPVDHGQYTANLHRAPGHQTAWVLAVGDATLPARLTTPSFANLTLTTQIDGITLCLPFQGPTRINGNDTPFAPLSPIPHIAWGEAALAPWTSLKAMP